MLGDNSALFEVTVWKSLRLDQAIRGRPLSAKTSQIILTAEEENRHVLSVSDFVEFYAITPSYARKMISELVQNGWLMRVGKGQYQLLPAKSGLDPYPCGDKFLVACQRFPDSFIAFGSAAEYHGLTQQIFPSVLLINSKYSGKRSIGNTSTTLFKIPSFGFVGFEPINRGPNFRVSTIERAIIDCIDRPQLCGGISDLPEILYRAKNQVDVERVIEYLPTYDSKSLICKVACLLEKAAIGYPRPRKRSFRNSLPA